MRSRSIMAITTATLALSSGCHSTQLAATWAEPNTGPIAFHKTVAVFVTKDEALRRMTEEKIASKFVNGVPSYRVIPNIQTGDQSSIMDQLRGTGFDGAVVMRVVDVTTTPAYVPGNYWYASPYTFAGYWGAAWAYPYDPSYFVQDQVVSVETQVYSLTDDKLIYAARSETTNPASAKKLTDSVIRHVRDNMKKRGLIALQHLNAAGAIAVE
jgi:hypothetical protein